MEGDSGTIKGVEVLGWTEAQFSGSSVTGAVLTTLGCVRIKGM